MNTRDFIRDYVIPAGGELVRKRGDHHIYRFPNGQSMPVPVGGVKYKEAKAFMIARLRRVVSK